MVESGRRTAKAVLQIQHSHRTVGCGCRPRRGDVVSCLGIRLAQEWLSSELERRRTYCPQGDIHRHTHTDIRHVRALCSKWHIRLGGIRDRALGVAAADELRERLLGATPAVALQLGMPGLVGDKVAPSTHLPPPSLGMLMKDHYPQWKKLAMSHRCWVNRWRMGSAVAGWRREKCW